jgi:hypothetical protein
VAASVKLWHRSFSNTKVNEKASNRYKIDSCRQRARDLPENRRRLRGKSYFSTAEKGSAGGTCTPTVNAIRPTHCYRVGPGLNSSPNELRRDEGTESDLHSLLDQRVLYHA